MYVCCARICVSMCACIVCLLIHYMMCANLCMCVCFPHICVRVGVCMYVCMLAHEELGFSTGVVSRVPNSAPVAVLCPATYSNYILSHVHAYHDAYIHKHTNFCPGGNILSYIHICIHTYINTYTARLSWHGRDFISYIHTYIHTYI